VILCGARRRLYTAEERRHAAWCSRTMAMGREELARRKRTLPRCCTLTEDKEGADVGRRCGDCDGRWRPRGAECVVTGATGTASCALER
jgi:hypothetical protein